MESAELILMLLVVSAAMAVLADRLAIPYPLLLVLGGAALPFIPDLPRLSLDPETVFVLFVPPLLYRAAATTSLRDFRANIRAISFLSVVMVLATMCAVAVVARALVPDLPWPAAFALGAIVSPSDAVTALAVTRRLQVPRKIMTVLLGEALVNDASALVAYRVAVAAALTGAFSLRSAAMEFLVDGLGGVLLGLALGRVIVAIRRRVRDMPTIDSTVSLLTPFAAYVPAEYLGWSGVLAVVSVGFYVGRWIPSMSSASRLQSDAMWEMIVFVLESLVFIFVGLELPYVFQGLEGLRTSAALGYAVAISAVVIGVRLVLVFPRAWLASAFDRWRGDRESPTNSRETFLVGWAGMRGGDSLVVALSLPLALHDGTPLPARSLVIFLTWAVIVMTLFVQGFSLRFVATRLRLPDDGNAEREERAARNRMVDAALSELGRLAANEHVSAGERSHLADIYARRVLLHAGGVETQPAVQYSRARLALIGVERATLLRMRDDGEIGDDVMRRILRDLDFETSILEPRQRAVDAMSQARPAP